MIHKQLEAVTYSTSSGLTFGGWLMLHLPSPDVTAQIASWVGIGTGILMFALSAYYQYRNSKLYQRALEKGYVTPPSSKK